MGKGIGDDKIAVAEALHEGGGAEAVCAVVGEVGFTEDVEAGDIAHQVVINPETAHCIVDGGIDHHGHFVGVIAGDLLVHGEQVAVAVNNR